MDGRTGSTGGLGEGEPRPRGDSSEAAAPPRGGDHHSEVPRPEDSRLEQMLARLEEMERVIREDSGARSSAPTGAAVAVGPGVSDARGGASSGVGVVESIVADLERMAQPVHEFHASSTPFSHAVSHPVFGFRSISVRFPRDFRSISAPFPDFRLFYTRFRFPLVARSRRTSVEV